MPQSLKTWRLLFVLVLGFSFAAEARQLQSRGAARTSVNRGGGHSRPGGGGGGIQREHTTRPGGGGGAQRPDRTNVDHRTNINNKNVNINDNRDVNINVDAHGGGYYGGGYYNDYHPVATAVAVTAATTLTAYAIGSMLQPSQVPSTGCVTVNKNNIAYMQCGTTWLQPQYQGTNVTYIVVAAP